MLSRRTRMWAESGIAHVSTESAMHQLQKEPNLKLPHCFTARLERTRYFRLLAARPANPAQRAEFTEGAGLAACRTGARRGERFQTERPVPGTITGLICDGAAGRV
jgi:hypothetical protein